MPYFVLAAWALQAAVGLSLLLQWLRHGRRSALRVLSHAALGLLSLGLWTIFLVSDASEFAWSAFAVMNVGNAIGDSMLISRWRRMHGTSGFVADYGGAIGAVFRGQMPPAVAFHALFSGIVYFSCLGVCIGATVSG